MPQYFENNGSRGVYQDVWYACTFGPLIPWINTEPDLGEWDSAKDKWELYDLTKEFSQANNLASSNPEKLTEMKQLFFEQAKGTQVFPIGAGIWLRIHPEDALSTPYTEWTFDSTTTHMPEFTVPGLGKKSNTVTIAPEIDENASCVLYALGGANRGLTCYLDAGYLVYEYNLMIIERFTMKSKTKLNAGKHTVVIDTTLPRPGASDEIIMTTDGSEVARMTTKRTAPLVFTASETFDVESTSGHLSHGRTMIADHSSFRGKSVTSKSS
jgi:hypothetical protein